MHCGAILKCKTRCHALIICVPAPSAKKAAFRSGCSLADLLRLAAARERVEHFPEFPACCNSISGAVGGGGGGWRAGCIMRSRSVKGVIIFLGLRGFAQATPTCWKSVAGSFCRLRTPGHTHRKRPDNSCILRI